MVSRMLTHYIQFDVFYNWTKGPNKRAKGIMLGSKL